MTLRAPLLRGRAARLRRLTLPIFAIMSAAVDVRNIRLFVTRRNPARFSP